jgi:PD-(D/E)XK nuclease superfamily
MHSIKDTLVERLSQQDGQRDRSTQVNVGPSEIGGCATKLWHKVNGTEPTNPNTLRLSAIMGTAIHTLIESVFASDEAYLTEATVESDGITGHIDLVDLANKTIWDWKTTTKNSLGFFPSTQQREQVQIYGFLANANGIDVEQVGLVAICRDGNESDIVEHVEAYSEPMAWNAINRYLDIREQYEPPAPEKSVDFCEKYCHYFGACTGITSPSTANEITNPEVIELVKQYKDLNSQAKTVKESADFAKMALDGVQGITPDGTIVKWSSVSGRTSIDEEAVQEALGYVPKKQGSPTQRLTVK